jgi:hypothetical protein
MTGGAPTLSSPRLHALARRAAEPSRDAQERCDLCNAPISQAHRHLLDLDARELMCACRACSLLFDRGAAGGGHFRLVPGRRLRLDGFAMSDLVWEELRIPVDMAFFHRSSSEQRVVALYPGPMGATESLLGLEAWEQLEADNPVLASMEADVEALLVNRARGARQQWLVGIDTCFDLVGLIRSRWRGLTGGKEVWTEIASFFERLDEAATPAPSVAERRS